ncbi:MAG: ABC transporter ATP-binding protein [Thermoplasmata archaeon]
MNVIDVSNLKVTYDGKNYAVNGISFQVNEGEIFGFLGPNGAGKTTTIRVLTTLIKPSSGVVKVLGMDVVEKALEIRNNIGVILQQPSYEWSLSVENNLSMYGTLWNIPKDKKKKMIDELTEEFDLSDIRKKKAEDLSIGQRRRLQIVRELMHDSKLLFLDEPTIGLDPIAKKKLLDYFRGLADRGVTIFFTTHNLTEADYICDRVAIINQGMIHAIDSVENLKKKYEGDQTLEILLSEKIDNLISKIKNNVSDVIFKMPKNETEPSIIITKNLPEVLSIINNYIKDTKSEILWFNIKKTELEEVFFRVVKGDQVEQDN